MTGENRVMTDAQSNQHIQICPPVVEHLRLKSRIAAGFIAAGTYFQLIRKTDFRLIDRADLADDSLRLNSGCPHDPGVD